MENSFFKFKLTHFKRSRYTHLRLLVISTFMLFAGQIAMAQKVPTACGNAALYTINFEDATTKTSANAKMQLSGAIGANDRVVFNTGTTVTGGVNFAGAAKYSTFTGGYLSQTLTNPTLVAGQDYAYRVYTADTTCYVDFTFKQPYVNFSTLPLYPDIKVTASALPANPTVGSNVVTTIVVTNEGDSTAFNVKITVGIPTSLQYISNVTSGGASTYTSGTGIWDIGTLLKGESRTIAITVKILQEGISFMTANTTSENDPYGGILDRDSTPSAIPAGEDDEATVCISTPFTYCLNDSYKIVLPNYFTNFKWTFTPTAGAPVDLSIGGTTSTPGAVMNTSDKSLTITATGTVNYSYTIGTCPVAGCCPITIINGLQPKLVGPTIPNGTICSTSTFAPITVALQDPTNPLLTGTQVTYNWFSTNVGGTTSVVIAGQAATNTLNTFPTAPGTYYFKLVARRGDHVNCRDSVMFSLKINSNPTGPGITGNPFVACQYAPSMTLAPSPTTGTLKWYQDGTTTAFQAAAPVITTNSPIPATPPSYWYVSTTDANGCESQRTAIQYTVNAAPATLGTAPLVYCQNQTSIPALTATGIGGTNTPNWYSSTGVSTAAPVPVTTAAGLQYFYVSQTDAKGCESIKATLTVTVKPQPVAALLTLDATCNGVIAQPNAKIYLTRYKNDDKVTWNPGATYNSATALPTPLPGTTPLAGGLIIGTLANPTAATDSYTVRITGANLCTVDRIATITKKDCGCAASCEPATITKTN
jgi:uncharacterized repeat protein (TIGR01451 family)